MWEAWGLEPSLASRGQRGVGWGTGDRGLRRGEGLCKLARRGTVKGRERKSGRLGRVRAERTRALRSTFPGSPKGAVARAAVTSGPPPGAWPPQLPSARASAPGAGRGALPRASGWEARALTVLRRAPHPRPGREAKDSSRRRNLY